jgi:hypothetical protein
MAAPPTQSPTPIVPAEAVALQPVPALPALEARAEEGLEVPAAGGRRGTGPAHLQLMAAAGPAAPQALPAAEAALLPAIASDRTAAASADPGRPGGAAEPPETASQTLYALVDLWSGKDTN